MRCRGTVILFALLLAGCQTVEEELPTINTWGRATPSQESSVSAVRVTSASASRNPVNPNPTFLEGSGRFVGQSGSGSDMPTYSDEENITLNLVNVSAPQAAKTILGDILTVNYTVDPAIEGKITIQTPKPVAVSTVIELFEAALRANGAAIVKSGDKYRIVPLDQAPIGARIETNAASKRSTTIGSNVKVVQLKYVSASEIRRVLEPIVPRGSIVRTDDARNIITLSGTDDEVAAAVDAISLFDIDVMKGMSFSLVPVKTSNPEAIAEELKAVFTTDREGPMSGMVRFLPNKRINAILVISPQAQYLRRATTLIQQLDARAQGTEKQLYTYSVQNRRAQELVDVLQSMFSTETGRGKTKSPPRNVAPQFQEASLQSSGPQGTGPSSSSTFGDRFGASKGSQPLRADNSNSQPSQTQSNGLQLGQDAATDGPKIKVVADEAKNSILIEADNTDYQRILRIIRALDVMPKQVLIEATIAEVTLNDQLKFGVRWYLENRNSESTFTDALTGAVSSVFPGFSYALAASKIALTINALNDITDVNVISTPSLTVMDNKPAVLQIGDQVPIVTQSAVSVVTPGSPVVNSVSYRDTGVILSITPQINESGRVLLDIEQEVSSVAPTTTSGIDSPTIRQRRIKTSVVVNNGDGLVLGGLIQDSKTLSRKQVPIAGDIPIIGNAFRHKNNDIGKTELIIIIKPQVIRNLREAWQITDEFRREFEIQRPYERRRLRNIERTVRRTFE